MKHIKSFKVFESSTGLSLANQIQELIKEYPECKEWMTLYMDWKDKTKPTESEGQNLDAFRRELVRQKKWNDKWETSFDEAYDRLRSLSLEDGRQLFDELKKQGKSVYGQIPGSKSAHPDAGWEKGSKNDPYAAAREEGF